MAVLTSKAAEAEARAVHAAAQVEAAREHLMAAAKSLHDDSIPSELHRDVLFTMDSCRDRINDLADFSDRLGGVR